MRLPGPDRLAAAALLLAAAAPIETAASAEKSMTLDEAIGLALEKYDPLQIERESHAAAVSAVDGARGAYDPRLEMDGGWVNSREPVNSALSGAPEGQLAPEFESVGGGAAIRQLLPTGGLFSVHARGDRETTDGTFALLSPAYGTRVGVELRQPLLRDLGIDAARLSVRTAEADRRGADASLRSVQIETVARVERVYWALVAVRQGTDVREEAVRLAEEQLAETQIRVESGAAPETEIAQPRAELERRRGELYEAREAIARVENRLKILILGDDDPLWLSRIAPAEDVGVEAAPVDTAAALDSALSDRPELDAAQSRLERRREEAKYARNGVWPSLDLVASYDRFGLAGTENPAADVQAPASLSGGLGDSFETLGEGDFDAARVALVLDFPIRNRTARSAAEVARRVERQAEVDLAGERKAIRAEVLDALAALETAGQRIEVTRSAREAAEIQLDAEKDLYETGLSTNFLVLTRQNDLSAARLDEISAHADYRIARSELARATGSLLEDRGITAEGMENGGGL